ncbi:UNVERIFIED_CONTAM: hypothetical protein Cloal_0359 [Acetivibrio alkalicellulosi]
MSKLLIVRLITNPLLRSSEEIRNNLFEALPRGTKMDDVLKHIESKKGCEIDWINNDTGFSYTPQRGEPIGGKDRVIGEN